NRSPVIEHLLGRLNLELGRVLLATHNHLRECRNVRRGGVHQNRGDSLRLPKRSQLRLSSALSTRWEDGSARDLKLTGSVRFYRETGRNRLFFVTVDGQYGHHLDLDNRSYLGGDSGLRGYPQRWAGGESFARFSVEQRYYTDWFPWRLFRVGGAIFADVGRTWGPDGLGSENPGVLASIGLGLRLSNARSAFARVIHVDFAVPLDSDPGLKKVQFLIEARREF
ncbi:BamA/TamA family outer membrane protein, partial [Silanimonas sp.]|uniref:BamA/TamA family outer membrane protein n=1 Tax=Silanimonas sp. TaxID=1929290 RepID=UPI0022C5A344